MADLQEKRYEREQDFTANPADQNLDLGTLAGRFRTSVVTFLGVSKSFTAVPGPVDRLRGKKPKTVRVVEDLTFDVPDREGIGEFIGILGPSGCGKSTILKLIAGLGPQHPPSTGLVLTGGQPVTGPGPDRGMVFQEYSSFPWLTVRQNLEFALRERKKSREEARFLAMEWIRKVRLREIDADKYPRELSGGMRQRLALARTLCVAPRIILMDEPFGALDPYTRWEMQDLIVELWREQKTTVFFVTHDHEEAVYVADRIFLLTSAPGRLAEVIEVPPPGDSAIAALEDRRYSERVSYVRARVKELSVTRE